MFARLVYQSFRRQRRRKLLAGVAVMLGVAVATAMLGVATDIGDKINHELRAYGPNLVVTPEEDSLDVNIGGVSLKPVGSGAFLQESDLSKLQAMFWWHNILGFAPQLVVPVVVATSAGSQTVPMLGTYFSKAIPDGKAQYITGVTVTNPWWKVSGRWPSESADSREILLGETLAVRLGRKPGDILSIAGHDYPVVGVLSSGGAEDAEILAPLLLAQQLGGNPGAIGRLMVSALIKSEDTLARRDPKSMSPVVFDRWYCSPYARSIAYQLQEAIPHSRAQQIRQVAQNEGSVLNSIQGLMLLITLAALIAAILAVAAAMATAILERRAEVGLMRALGAGSLAVTAVFLAEAAIIAILGGTAGYLLGEVLARQIGSAIFSSNITLQPVLFPVVLTLAVLVTFAGSAAAIRRALRFDPVHSLRGPA